MLSQISSTPVSATQVSAATQPVRSAPVGSRAADGDYKVRSANTSSSKDSDGDYKSLAASAVTKSSSGVQAALSGLKAGG